jgi:hypothetical protein
MKRIDSYYPSTEKRTEYLESFSSTYAHLSLSEIVEEVGRDIVLKS